MMPNKKKPSNNSITRKKPQHKEQEKNKSNKTGTIDESIRLRKGSSMKNSK